MQDKKLYIAIVLAGIFGACGQGAPQSDLAGNYTRLDSNQFCKIKQVVTIQPATTAGNNEYTVSIKSWTDYFDERQDQLKERPQLSAKFDQSTGILTTNDPGIVFYFDPNNNQVKLNKLVLTKQ